MNIHGLKTNTPIHANKKRIHIFSYKNPQTAPPLQNELSENCNTFIADRDRHVHINARRLDLTFQEEMDHV